MSDPNATYAPVPATVVRRRFRRPAGRAWLRVDAAATQARVFLNGTLIGTHLGAWTPFEFEITDNLRDDNELELRCEDRFHVTQGFLPVIGVRWTGVVPCYDDAASADPQPAVRILAAPTPASTPARQRSAVSGTQLFVDGQPLRVRGMLHWGYYPAQRNPWPGEAQMRREITELQALGFNLIKFCLWIPPRRYYELCDELGMLVWQEYPVWNAPLGGAGTQQFHQALASSGEPLPSDDEIAAEYREFLLNDRGHGCIVLRSMTCENDHVSPAMSRRLIDLAHELVPGCLALDNSGWLCNEQVGDFHDEHPYVHNAQWVHYAARMREKRTKPLLLGETMVSDTLNESTSASAAELEYSYAAALSMRRFQIETLARDLPDVGYVVCGLRDLEKTPLGIYTHDGRPKYGPQDWDWHGKAGSAAPWPQALPSGAASAAADPVQPALGGILGPRKGAWKCRDNNWWSPLVRVLDDRLPRELIQREAAGELLSGRILTQTAGTRVLVEQLDVHSGELRHNPLVIEFRSAGRWRIVSAFRHDTPAGRMLWQALRGRIDGPAIDPPPEIGPLLGTSLVLEDWEMRRDDQAWEVHQEPPPFDVSRLPHDGWIPVKCDTPLVNAGRNLFEGWATFRTAFACPAGRIGLVCESVADYFELYLDGEHHASAGPRHGTWDGARDAPRTFELRLTGDRHQIVLRARDWRAAGGLIGPIYLTTNDNERIF